VAVICAIWASFPAPGLVGWLEGEGQVKNWLPPPVGPGVGWLVVHGGGKSSFHSPPPLVGWLAPGGQENRPTRDKLQPPNAMTSWPTHGVLKIVAIVTMKPQKRAC